MNQLDHYQGSLMGLAVGDALGTTLEFKSPGSFKPIKDMVGGGPFRLQPGEWTDDTSMALCLGESLLEKRGFDPADQMKRYCRWFHEGHRSSTGRCFDIGNTVHAALDRFSTSGKAFSGSQAPNTAGNGSLMRLAPVPMFFGNDAAKAIAYCGESSKTTHGAATCVDACRYYGGLIWAALAGVNKAELLSPSFSPLKEALAPVYCEPIQIVADGSYKKKNPPEIRGTGYVVESLEAALWAFDRSESFEEGCLLAVNLGDDADTTGAIYGQLAGAYYGLGGIPSHWVEKIKFREDLLQMAQSLQEGSGITQ
jgi:ADP-ribosyl-[dinitrogen reductase] hydrolase